MRSKKLSKHEIAKQLWQHFSNLLSQLRQSPGYSLEKWIAICECSSLVNQIGDSLMGTLEEFSFKMLSVYDYCL